MGTLSAQFTCFFLLLIFLNTSNSLCVHMRACVFSTIIILYTEVSLKQATLPLLKANTTVRILFDCPLDVVCPFAICLYHSCFPDILYSKLIQFVTTSVLIMTQLNWALK